MKKNEIRFQPSTLQNDNNNNIYRGIVREKNSYGRHHRRHLHTQQKKENISLRCSVSTHIYLYTGTYCLFVLFLFPHRSHYTSNTFFYVVMNVLKAFRLNVFSILALSNGARVFYLFSFFATILYVLTAKRCECERNKMAVICLIWVLESATELLPFFETRFLRWLRSWLPMLKSISFFWGR